MATATTNAKKTTNMMIANEIMRQLGPQTIMLLGASLFLADERSLMFSFKSCRKSNKIRITLGADDLYKVEFFRFDRKTLMCPVVASYEGIYADMLHDLIEREVGYYVTFHAR